jgi:hypothetical protein
MIITQVKLKIPALPVLAPNMSQPTPMSRAMMQQLKSQKEEKVRLNRVKQISDSIYDHAIQRASASTDTSFKHQIPRGRYNSMGDSSDPFYLNNMTDILAELQTLFPGCSVTHSLMAKGRDGKLYDLSKLDDSVLPFVDQTLEQSYIVIDWS